MRTRLFVWAKQQGLSMQELAAMTGYSKRHLNRIKAQGCKVAPEFAARIVYRLGDWARSLFLPG